MALGVGAADHRRRRRARGPVQARSTRSASGSCSARSPSSCSSRSRSRSSSAIVLAQTRFGRYTYAIGSNAEAARRAGVNVDRHLIKVYALAGMLAGLAGFLSLARFATTTIGGHSTDNLDAIAAVVIGGTSLFGGIGTILGTRRRRVHPGRAAERLRDRRRPAVLAAGRRRRRPDRRRLPRPAAARALRGSESHIHRRRRAHAGHTIGWRRRCSPRRSRSSWPRAASDDSRRRRQRRRAAARRSTR